MLVRHPWHCEVELSCPLYFNVIRQIIHFERSAEKVSNSGPDP